MSEFPTAETAAEVDAEEFRAFYLSDLLRRCRAKTRVPAGYGFVSPYGIGVSQELAAQMLSIGDRQYRRFECGLVMHPDLRFLDQVARVLEMSAAERDALYRLAAQRPPHTPSDGDIDVRGLQSTLDSLEVPAIVTDIAWNYVAWNRLATEYLVDPDELPPDSRNAILLGFGPVGAALFPTELPDLRTLVGRVRFAYLAAGGQSRALQGLVERLLQIPEAAAQWKDGPLAIEPPYQPRTLVHSLRGSLKVRTVRTEMPDRLRICQFIPERREA